MRVPSPSPTHENLPQITHGVPLRVVAIIIGVLFVLGVIATFKREAKG